MNLNKIENINNLDKYFLNPSEFLRSLYLERKDRNYSYSTRAFARDLGISQTLLSLIMNNKRPLTIKQATKMSMLLDLSNENAKKLIDSTFSILPEENVSRLTKAELSHKDFEVERFIALSRWYHVAILDLVTTKNFKEDASWIARRLGINPIEAKDALNRLLELGMLERFNNRLIKPENRIYFATTKSEPAVRKFHSDMIDKAKDQLELVDDESFNARQISSITMAIPKKSLKEAKERIKKFQQELAVFLGKNACDEVYQMNIQFFPLTKKINLNKKQKEIKKGAK